MEPVWLLLVKSMLKILVDVFSSDTRQERNHVSPKNFKHVCDGARIHTDEHKSYSNCRTLLIYMGQFVINMNL